MFCYFFQYVICIYNNKLGHNVHINIFIKSKMASFGGGAIKFVSKKEYKFFKKISVCNFMLHLIASIVCSKLIIITIKNIITYIKIIII